MSDYPDYFTRLAAAFIRGSLRDDAIAAVYRSLFSTPLDALSDDEQAFLIELGLERGLRLHRFKRTMGLPRVQRVLGVLKGLQPASVLDIGSGRGAFLWPLLDAFPTLPITALDRLDYRVRDLEAVRDGGVMNLVPAHADVTALTFASGSSDVVTMLEVLEHIPDWQRALAEACRVARRFLLLSVHT